jgi:RimJ/RimL family protein N-acetyltransferase
VRFFASDTRYEGTDEQLDGLLMLVRYCFETRNLRRLEAAALVFDEARIEQLWRAGFVHEGTISLNARVMRQMKKVGFALEVRRRKGIYADGVWHDELIYGLFREDWPGRAALVEKSGPAARR